MADENLEQEELEGEEEEVETDEFGNPVTDEEGEDDAEDDEAEDSADEEEDSDEEDSESGDEDGDDESDSSDSDEPKTDAEISSLRQMTRALRLQNRELEQKLEKLNQALVDKDIVAEDELSEEDKTNMDARNTALEEMVELMELNPKYEDVKDVCSQSNFDDVVEMLANAYVQENGGDVDEVYTALAGEIWQKPNPYKEIYGLVKQLHPRYAKAEEVEEEPAKPAPKKKAHKAAPSLSDLPASSSSKSSGWTAKRIDSMPEEDLGKVPADVYEKYMAGELD